MSLMKDAGSKWFAHDAAGHAELSNVLPQVADAYDAFTGQCFRAGELDERTKQLIALGVALYANQESGMHKYIQGAQAYGATDTQIMEAAAVAAAVASVHTLSHVADSMRLAQHDGEGTFVNAIEPDRLRSHMQDYLQDTEFAQELEKGSLRASERSGWEGMAIPGGTAVSPSY